MTFAYQIPSNLNTTHSTLVIIEHLSNQNVIKYSITEPTGSKGRKGQEWFGLFCRKCGTCLIKKHNEYD